MNTLRPDLRPDSLRKRNPDLRLLEEKVESTLHKNVIFETEPDFDNKNTLLNKLHKEEKAKFDFHKTQENIEEEKKGSLSRIIEENAQEVENEKSKNVKRKKEGEEEIMSERVKSVSEEGKKKETEIITTTESFSLSASKELPKLTEMKMKERSEGDEKVRKPYFKNLEIKTEEMEESLTKSISITGSKETVPSQRPLREKESSKPPHSGIKLDTPLFHPSNDPDDSLDFDLSITASQSQIPFPGNSCLLKCLF